MPSITQINSVFTLASSQSFADTTAGSDGAFIHKDISHQETALLCAVIYGLNHI